MVMVMMVMVDLEFEVMVYMVLFQMCIVVEVWGCIECVLSVIRGGVDGGCGFFFCGI